MHIELFLIGVEIGEVDIGARACGAVLHTNMATPDISDATAACHNFEIIFKMIRQSEVVLG